MAHSTFSRKSLGMAVAIAVGITAAPAVASGPVATIVPAAHAAEAGETTLTDDAVKSVSVRSFPLYKGHRGGAGTIIPDGGRDNRGVNADELGDMLSQYKITVQFFVPASDNYSLYTLSLKNISGIDDIEPSFEETSGARVSDSETSVNFDFAPIGRDKTYEYTIYAYNEITDGQDVEAAIIGNKETFHSWTMNVPDPNNPKPAPSTTKKPAPKPSTTAKPTPTTKKSEPKPTTKKSEPKPKPEPSSKPTPKPDPKPSTTAQPAPTGDITAIDVDDNGNYIITANGKKYEMKVGALRDNVDNLNELVKQQRVDIAELEKKDAEVLKQAEKKIAATEKKLDALKQDVDAGTADKEAQRRAIAGISASIVNINNELNTVHAAITQLTGQDIKEVRNNGDGSFTLIRNNGEEVHGNITVDTDEAITTITTDDAGNLVVTNGAGESITVEINRTTVEESTEGDKDLVTITTPTGDVTFEVGNTYISDVVQTDDGNFDIYRNDVEGVWKSIDLSDLRQEITQTQDRVEALKKQHAKDTEEIKKQREKDATALNTRIDATNTKLTAAEGAIRALKGRATKVEKRVTDIEGSVKVISKDIATINKAIDVLDKRVTNLERHDEDWAKCYSGIGQAAIPLAFAVPLGFLAGLDLPGFDTANANLQHQIGAFNPAAAAWLDENRGGVRAAAGVLGIASVIGIIAHAATTCQDYNASDAAKDTDLAQTSSKIVERFVRTDKADN